MGTFTIGQVAERTGFTASALRYYEGLGLVAPATRTEAGYRIYDETALHRLAFIARAKQLGCSLEEITDLLGIWDGDRCSPVQRRFHDLVTEKIRATQDQVMELTAFGSQLQSAAAQLGAPPIDGPCDDDCACLSENSATSAAASPVVPLLSPASDSPIACTLQPDAMPERLAAWQAVLSAAVARSTTMDGRLRIEFTDEVDFGELARLVAAEQRCCAFFSFALTLDARGIALEVGASETAAELVATVFGKAS